MAEDTNINNTSENDDVDVKDDKISTEPTDTDSNRTTNTNTNNKSEEVHEHTLKYEKMLKDKLGKHYISDWDKLGIENRISKMETVLEFNTKMESDKRKEPIVKREAKVPLGASINESNDSSKNKYFGTNWKKINQEIFGN